MAYRNEDGAITIDEQVAMRDVSKSKDAAATLQAAADSLTRLITQAENYEGQTARAIDSRAQELLKRIKELIRRLEYSQEMTIRVVRYYEMLDRACRDALQSAGSGH